MRRHSGLQELGGLCRGGEDDQDIQSCTRCEPQVPLSLWHSIHGIIVY
jgi:hypothetical protein